MLKFGIPAILASFLGAWLLLKITVLPAWFEYSLWDKTFEVTPVKLIIAMLLISFSILEISPSFQKVQFGRNKLVLGGYTTILLNRKAFQFKEKYLFIISARRKLHR